MQNLNKYTKAELISKFKRLENKNSNQSNQTLAQGFFSNILLFKNMLIKITLITFLIKTFRKYSIFRRIWVILNTIVMTIFGISILDFYGVTFLISFYTEITSIVGNIINYLTHTQFYNVLSGLFTSKIEVKQPTSILGMRTNNSSSTGSQTSNESNSKINEWFNREEKIEESDNRKYYIIAGLLILSCLAWYYYGDDIKPIVTSGIERIKNLRRRPDNNQNMPDNNQNIETMLNNTIAQDSWKDSLSNIWNKFKRKPNNNIENNNNTSEIELVDNTQPTASSSNVKIEDIKNYINPIQKHIPIDHPKKSTIDPAYFTTPSSESDNEYNNYFKNMPDKGKTVIIKSDNLQEYNELLQKQITGDSYVHFKDETSKLLQSINAFINLEKTQNFKNQEYRNELYITLREKMTEIYNKYPDLYNEWYEIPRIESKIDQFISLDNLIEEGIKTPLKSDTYEEIALATAQEQEAWSDKAKSPQLHSPVNESIQNENKSFVPELLDELDKVGYKGSRNIMDQVAEDILKENQGNLQTQPIASSSNVQLEQAPPINPRFNLLEQIRARRNEKDIIDDVNKELPQIEVNTGSSSDNSIDHYLPNQEQNISTQENPNVNIPSNSQNISNPEIPIENIQDTNQDITNTSQVGLTPILERVKGLFTPKIENKTLSNKPSISNLLEDTNALFDDIDSDPIDTNIIDPSNNPETSNIAEASTSIGDIIWEKVSVVTDDNLKRVKIKFDETWRATKTIHFATSNNHTFSIEFDTVWLESARDSDNKLHYHKTINWAKYIGDDSPFNNQTKIKEIIIEDLNNHNHSIYKL